MTFEGGLSIVVMSPRSTEKRCNCGPGRLVLRAATGSTAESSFREIFVFGDSLSDTGNLASLPEFGFLNNPPFDRGFSNGPRAVEVLANSIGLEVDPLLHLVGPPVGTNFAVSGARARGTNPIDLPAQIGTFLLNNRGKAPSDALYIVFIGGNYISVIRTCVDHGLLRRTFWLLPPELRYATAGTRIHTRASVAGALCQPARDRLRTEAFAVQDALNLSDGFSRMV